MTVVVTNTTSDYETTVKMTAGQTTNALKKMEICLTESSCLLDFYRNIVKNRVGTGDIESQAKAMAHQETNKRGSLLPRGGRDWDTRCNFNLKFNNKGTKSTGGLQGGCYSGGEDKVTSDKSVSEPECDSETLGDRPSNREKKTCDRQPGLMIKLADIKQDQVKDMMKDAKDNIKILKRLLKTLVTGKQYYEIIKEISCTRAKTQASSSIKYNNKLQSLIRKHASCCLLHQEQLKWTAIKAGETTIPQSSQPHPSQPLDPNPKGTPTTLPSPSPPLPSDPKPNCIDPLISGTLITDNELVACFGGQENKSQSTVFGTVELDDDELSVMDLRPEFAVYDVIDCDKLEEEINITLTKIRWDRRERDGDDDVEPKSVEEAQEQVAEREEQMMQDAESRLVYNSQDNCIDMRARRATYMVHNTRLILPQPRPASEEAILGARQMVWRNTIKDFKDNNCAEDGTLKTHNMTTTQRVGVGKLKKRIKKGEIVVLPSDKGNRLTVSSIESYQQQGDCHTVQDRMITRDELERTQTRMNLLSRGLAKVFCIGENWGDRNSARCWTNLVSDSCVAPLLYPSPKTHKPLDDHGNPKTRPIVQASSCVTSRAGEILADFLDAALLSFPTQTESKSTEDMLARIDAANQKIREEGGDICVGSGDAVALYPSLVHKESARLCREMVLACPANITEIDIQAAGVFIATHCTVTEIQEAGLSKIVPRRKHKKGNHPGRSTDELIRRKNDQPEKFEKVRTNLTSTEIRKLVAKTIEVGVLSVIRNHVYRWRDCLWIQTLGVPTGLQISGIIGRVTMDHWRVKVQEIMKANNMKSFPLEKYVDDCETVMENVEVGTRWDEKLSRMIVTDETVNEDLEAGRERDMITMEAWGSMASSIVPGLRFTTDYCSRNESKTVPMLDFQVWKTKEEDPLQPGKFREAVRYSFFEKEMSNMKVLDNNSAMPHQVKVASMTQEAVRRLCNVSRELDDAHRCQILSKFMMKLSLSGYSQCARANILSGAVLTFRKKLRAESLGIQPVHRLGTFDQAARRREKIAGKTQWYKSGSTGWKRKLEAREAALRTTTTNLPDTVTKNPPTTHNSSHRLTSRTAPHNNTITPQQSSTQSSTQPIPSPAARTTTKPPHSHIEALMFVPCTPGGKLARSLQTEDDVFAKLHHVSRVKFIERGGIKVKDILGRKDPWAPKSCGRQDCMVCLSTIKKEGVPTTCFQENVCYLISCDLCRSKGVVVNYYGESTSKGVIIRTPFGYDL